MPKFQILYRVDPERAAVMSTHDTLADAINHATAVMGAQFLEIDKDYPDCADFLAGGCIYSIQPEGFKLK